MLWTRDVCGVSSLKELIKMKACFDVLKVHCFAMKYAPNGRGALAATAHYALSLQCMECDKETSV
jgi:hypothetical protein